MQAMYARTQRGVPILLQKATFLLVRSIRLAMSPKRVVLATSITGLVDEPLPVKRILVLSWGGEGRSGILMFDPKNTGLTKHTIPLLDSGQGSVLSLKSGGKLVKL